VLAIFFLFSRLDLLNRTDPGEAVRNVEYISTFELRSLVVTRQNRVNPLEKRCEDLKLLRCLIRPSLRHEKQRSFLFSRLDLLNRTDPGEAVRNVEYML
jgi:hypothetical protein